MHLVITDPVHQWQGDNDDIISHGRLYDVFTVELAQVYTCKYIDSMRGYGTLWRLSACSNGKIFTTPLTAWEQG